MSDVQCWLCGALRPCHCMAEDLDDLVDGEQGRPVDAALWTTGTEAVYARDGWLSTESALAGQHGQVLADAGPLPDLQRAAHQMWPYGLCTCGRWMGSTPVQVDGVMHRTDGPCYQCDTYGQRLSEPMALGLEHRRGLAESAVQRWEVITVESRAGLTDEMIARGDAVGRFRHLRRVVLAEQRAEVARLVAQGACPLTGTEIITRREDPMHCTWLVASSMVALPPPPVGD